MWGIICGFLLYSYLYPYVEHQFLLIWLSVKTLVPLIRLMFTLRYVALGHPSPWQRLFHTLHLVDGLSWGSLALGIGESNAPVVAPVVICGLVIVFSTAAYTLRANHIGYFFYTTGAAIIAVPLLLFRAGGYFWISGVLLFLFHGAFMLGVRRSSKELARSILVRINAETLAQQRAEALALAEERSRVKNLFMATMTHELRTPLHGILGLSQLARSAKSREELLQRLNLLDKSGETLLAIVDDILDFSQMEAGEVAVHARLVDMRELISDVQHIAAGTAASKGLAFDIDLSLPTPCVLNIDPMRVRQVLLQLLGNAFKFTTEGRVRLLARLIGDARGMRLRLSVQDSGIGIDAEHLPRIFDPFHQGDNTYSRKYSGVGIGLTRALQIAHALGGDIRCESVVGQGSTFVFEVPVDELYSALPDSNIPQIKTFEMDGVNGSRPAMNKDNLLLNGVRILLAEDNDVNALVMLDQLEGLGAQVESVNDGHSAVSRACAPTRPDLVLMDCQMPGLDGFAATRMIRDHERQSGLVRLPIIAITALASDTDYEICMNSGMDGRLVKPVGIKIMEREILKILKNKGALNHPVN